MSKDFKSFDLARQRADEGVKQLARQRADEGSSKIKEIAAQMASWQPSSLTFPNHEPPPPNPNWTSEIYRVVMEWITEFEMNLDAEHEVGARLVNFGQTLTFYLERIDYSDSPLLRFKGSMDDGSPVELIQHVSQISILLTRLPRKNPDEPRKPIGFHVEHQADIPPKND